MAAADAPSDIAESAEPAPRSEGRGEGRQARVLSVSSGDSADSPACPKCGGRMWDNRATKRNPKAPDFKCRDRTCDGVIWPPKGNAARPAAPAAEEPAEERGLALDTAPLGSGMDDIPF